MKKYFLSAGLFVLISAATFSQPLIQSVVTDVRWGGRTVAITVHPVFTEEVIAASATGGLFKSTNGGATWRHLDNLPVFTMMDVKYNPIFTNKVIATCLVDTDTSHTMGIWISNDRGETWSQIAAPVIVTAWSSASRYNKRFSAYGVSFDVNGVAYVGTDYGIAVGKSGHSLWEHVVHDTRMAVATDKLQNAVFSVCGFGSGKLVIGAKSGVYYCNDMYLRKPFRKSASTIKFISQVTHGIARSPFSEKDFIIAPNDTLVMVSTDTALTFINKDMPPGGRTSRLPVVAIVRNPTLPDYLDIYIHKVQWWKKTCHKNELNNFDKAWEMMYVEHDDMNGFATVGDEVRYVASDGGVFKKISADRWRCVGQGRGGYNALQVYHVWGQKIQNFGISIPSGGIFPSAPGGPKVDYYMGTQDNNIWSSADGGRTWPYDGGIEGGAFEGPRAINISIFGSVAFVDNSLGQNRFSQPNFGGVSNWRNPGEPFGNPKYAGHETYVQFFFDTLSGDINIMKTQSYGIRWEKIGTISGYRLWQGEKVSQDSAFTMYIPYARPLSPALGFSNVGLMRFQKKVFNDGRPDTYSLSNMDTVRSMGSLMAYGADFSWPVVYGFDMNDAQKLLAPDAVDKVMKWSFDGGKTWRPDNNLTRLITENGRYTFGESAVNFLVWTVSFNPSNSRQIAIGTKDAGLIYTSDGGMSWCRIPGTKQIPNITSIWWDFNGTALISSYGRGLWRFNPAAFTKSGSACISNLITIKVKDITRPIADIPLDVKADKAQVSTRFEPAFIKPILLPTNYSSVSRPVASISTSTTRSGEMVVGDNGKITIFGYGFSATSNASIELEGKILINNIPVNKDGTIKYIMSFKKSPGIYTLQVVQYINNNKIETPVIVKVPFTDKGK
jgi:hypothetical protein